MAFKMMIPVALYIAVVLLAISNGGEAAIGINWGRQTAQRLVPSQVVDLLLQNGVGNARVYTPEMDILEAFAGSGINLTVSILNTTAFTALDDARSWVQLNTNYFVTCNIRYVFLGGYAFFEGLGSIDYRLSAIKSLKHLQNALNEAGHGDRVKATFLHMGGILNRNSTRPSDFEFLDEIKYDMVTALRFLQENNAPFVIELFPLIDIVYANNKDPNFPFPDNTTKQAIRDVNGAVYTNVVEFMHDAFVWALDKVNASNMKIIIGQVGWPTDGWPGANATSAERFYKSLLPWVVSDRGTPMRPGAPIDINVHALTDENQNPAFTSFTRHWGIYRSNGEPKYKIDLSGQGRDIYPTKVRGIMRMPDRWCVFNGNSSDLDKVKEQFADACKHADCTSMAPGASCSKLSFEQNISYAFNMMFQFKFQDEKACDFKGLGYVSVKDPSTGECVFPVEVVRGQQVNLAVTGNGFYESPNWGMFVCLLSVLVMLIWDRAGQLVV